MRLKTQTKALCFALTLGILAIFLYSCQKDTSKKELAIEETRSVPDCQYGYEWDPFTRRCVPVCPPGYVREEGQCVPAPPPPVIVNYAGVNITYETGPKILKFNSVSDVNTVIDQLAAETETYNTNYENQYPGLSEDQLDSVDQITNFDEFRKYKDFENLFSGFISKRSQLESTENAWLANNRTGTDPDALDFTIDDAENTVFNNNYQLKIGGILYELRTDGLYEVDGSASLASTNTVTAEECFSNHHNKQPFETSDGLKMFKLKVAINSWFFRSGAKGKVVSFKKKNGVFKRARTSLAVSCGGTIFNNQCSEFFTFSDRNPSPSGFKKRRQLKVARHQAGTIWRTKPGMLISSFDNGGSYFASLAID